MSFPQIGVSDIITTVNVVWTVYESVRDGPRSARWDFHSFRQEFHAIKTLLERIQKVKGSAAKDIRGLGSLYAETIQECAQFVNKHKQLAQARTPTLNGRSDRFGNKVSLLFEKFTWPLERSEAERLRRKLERCLEIATLKSTEETRDAALDFMRIAEHNQLENIEMLKSIKTMTAQISLLLRQCMLEGPNDTDPHDMHHPSQRGNRLRPVFLEPECALSAIPENDEVTPVGSQRYQKALDRIHEISERLSNLTRRLETPETPGRASPLAHSTSHTYMRGVDGVSSETPTTATVFRFLHQVSDDVRDALDMVGYGHEFVPNRDPPQRDHARVEPVQSINETAEGWKQFREWLDFQLVHAFSTNSIDPQPAHSPQSSHHLLLDGISPPPAIPIIRTHSRESDHSIISSPQSTVSMPIPDRKVPLTAHPVKVYEHILLRWAFKTAHCADHLASV
ncbi:hypothetical protein MPDQ_007329 [Monascus purpureus]|uniref:Fungal N-terminal domain-containing protein n=1 Tax=Monascus purpureus TaxID=5098 RepID=A0A507QUM8_MONPU|nr:hypothetical protein MPDQ_007329 [Monascus purpureus]